MDINYILLGLCCRISWNIQKLNIEKETGLFEWMRSEKFSDINQIIKKVVNNENVEITQREQEQFVNNDFLANTDIRTMHYTDRLDEIFKRRSQRFLNYIKSDKMILFIREDHPGILTTKQDIEEFKNYITFVNPECKYKILLLSPESDYNQIISENLLHKIYN